MGFVAFRIGELLFGFYWLASCVEASSDGQSTEILSYIILCFSALNAELELSLIAHRTLFRASSMIWVVDPGN